MLDVSTYRALRAVGMDQERAAHEADAVVLRDARIARAERGLTVLKGMLGLMLALQVVTLGLTAACLGMVWKQLAALGRAAGG